MITSSWSNSSLARQPLDDRRHRGAELLSEAGGGEQQAKEHADEAVPGLQPVVPVQEPHGDAEQEDE